MKTYEIKRLDFVTRMRNYYTSTNYTEIMKPENNIESRTKMYKIIILGDGGVGKTSLRRRFFGEGFSTEYMMTIGGDFAVKRQTIDNQECVLQFWDVAGQQRFKEVRSAYYSNASGIILVFDLTIPHTFENIANWVTEFSQNSNTNPQQIPMVVLGNKLDLRGEPGVECIPHEEGVKYTRELSKWSQYETKYFETSALVGLNVDTAFEFLIRSLSSI